MTKYTNTIVGPEFIKHRDEFAQDLYKSDMNKYGKADINNTKSRADFEWPEWWMGYYMTEITGHKRYNLMSYDTTHAVCGRCEFKYMKKTGFVTIGLYTQRQQFDNFIFWDWNKQFNSHLQEGQIVDFQLIAFVNRDEVLRDMKEDQAYDQYNYNKFNKHVLSDETVV